MEKDYCNFSDLEPMEKIMYYNSLYMFLSQLNLNYPIRRQSGGVVQDEEKNAGKYEKIFEKFGVKDNN